MAGDKEGVNPVTGRKMVGFALHPEHRWTKGRRKKGESLTEILDAEGKVRDVTTDKNERITRRAAIVRRVWLMAVNGDQRAIEFIFNRLEGQAEVRGQLEHLVDIGNLVILKDGDDRADKPLHEGAPETVGVPQQ